MLTSQVPRGPSARRTLSADAVTVDTSASMTVAVSMVLESARRHHDRGSCSAKSFTEMSNGRSVMVCAPPLLYAGQSCSGGDEGWPMTGPEQGGEGVRAWEGCPGGQMRLIVESRTPQRKTKT